MQRDNRGIVFVCSSGLHARLFAPAMRRLSAEGRFAPVVLSLDRCYAQAHGDVAATCGALALPAEVVEADMRHGDSPHRIARAAQSIASIRWRGLAQVAAVLRARRAALVVLGNDTGLAELTIISAARREGVPTLLVQDGFLANAFQGARWPRLQTRLARWRVALLRDLFGGNPYGMGGCDHFAAHGEFWKAVILPFWGRAASRIHVTGHPSLDFQPAAVPPDPAGPVVFFCTNFLRSNLRDAAAHEAQIDEIAALAAALCQVDGASGRLRVKLHPADDPADHARLRSVEGVELAGPDADLGALIDASWFCVTNLSSVSLHCLARGRACLLSGLVVGEGRYRGVFESLPSGLKFSTVEGFRSLAEALRSPAGHADRIEAELERLAPYVRPAPGAARSGAQALVEAMAGIGGLSVPIS